MPSALRAAHTGVYAGQPVGMDIVITMVGDPDELGKALAPFYNGVAGVSGMSSALGNWILHKQIAAGHHVGWVPRAVGHM